LSDALGRAAGRPFRGAVASVVAVVEGTAQVSTALEGVVLELDRHAATRHRLILNAFYPVVLGACLAGLIISMQALIVDGGYTPDPEVALVQPAGPVAILVLGVVAVALLFGIAQIVGAIFRPRLLPARRALQRVRVLRSCGHLLRAGMPLAHALQRAALAATSPRVVARALDASNRLEAGAPAAAVWQAAGFPDGDVARLVQGRGVALPAVLDDVAFRTEARSRRRLDRWCATLYPVSLLLFGAAVLWIYSSLARLWVGVMRESGGW
jgi:type II secretory pathway component PulF